MSGKRLGAHECDKAWLAECQSQTADVTRRLGSLLRKFRTGHAQWYAELLVASAFTGIIQPANNPAFDVLTDQYGRVEVKSRVDGTDGTQNRVNLGRYSEESFDYVAIIVLRSDYRVKGAVVLPCGAAIRLVRPAGHVKWCDAAEHPEAIDITAELVAVSGEEAG